MTFQVSSSQSHAVLLQRAAISYSAEQKMQLEFAKLSCQLSWSEVTFSVGKANFLPIVATVFTRQVGSHFSPSKRITTINALRQRQERCLTNTCTLSIPSMARGDTCLRILLQFIGNSRKQQEMQAIRADWALREMCFTTSLN